MKTNCRVPDEYILHNRSALLVGREVLPGLLTELSATRTALRSACALSVRRRTRG
jgi:hypothetical protein